MTGNHTYKRWDNIIKSEEDKREYRGLQLENGMKVLLVSDPLTDKSAAAIEVNVGKEITGAYCKVIKLYSSFRAYV